MWPFKSNKNKKRKYEGAAKGRRTSSWLTGSGDANSQIRHDLPTLRARSRDLRRNNAYIHKAIDVISNNVVGKGIQTQWDDENIEALWKEWAHSTNIDYDGRNDIRGLQRMVMEAVAESGEVLIRKRIVAGLAFPLQYQVLEADFLDSTILNTSPTQDGNFVIQGIEFDGNGKRVGYHIYESHPGSVDHPFNSLNSNFIPANEILHIYRAERPGQVRGVPWPSPVMIKTKDLDDFEDAQLMRQKVAACFTAFVHDISADVDCDDDSDLGEKIEPALIEHLPPGKTITFANPPSVENYKEFTSSHLRAIAAGMGLSYESLTGDLTETNYSSGRMGHLSMQRNVDSWREGIIITHMMSPIVEDFKNIASILGTDASRAKATHIPPMREMIDPTKEIPAMVDSIRAGLSSRSEAVASLGKDPNDVQNQIQKDNQKADELGLILDSDPRKTNSSGKLHDGVNDNE
jgi:lambda family phage portal protein